MTEPILSTDYWKQRLAKAKELHQAIFRCPLTLWQQIEVKHREILAQHIKPDDSILDAGCGWGRLLTLLPEDWQGEYLGVDLSPGFIELAQSTYRLEDFIVGDLRNLTFDTRFDWAILISIRPMVKRNLGDEAWNQMEFELKRKTTRLLFLEYDLDHPGEVI